MAEIFRELRKTSYGDALDKYFSLGRDLNQRDTIAVRKTVSALIKIGLSRWSIYKGRSWRNLVRALEYRRKN